MNILYTRFNTSRKNQYRLRTEVVSDGNKNYVHKVAEHKDAVPHVMSMLENKEILKNETEVLLPVDAWKVDEVTVGFSYIEDLKLFEQEITEAFTHSKEKFIELVEEYKKMLSSMRSEVPSYRFRFFEQFGEYFKTDSFIYPGCVDLNFGNLFRKQSKWVVIDYEWLFPCAFPLTYILVRSLTAWYTGLVYNPYQYTLQEILSWIGITETELDETIHVEYVLQSLVNIQVPEKEVYYKGAYASLVEQAGRPTVYSMSEGEEAKKEVTHIQEKQKLLTREMTQHIWGTTIFPTYDIIIPVFNGYEFVRDCVESVLEHTVYPSYRILLIDDCSTDIETVGYMVEMSERHEHIIYLRQKENGGFVRSVNTGMAYGTHDVVLLNSDTVVTENWLLQMHQCRQQVGSVGSITPLTNNGTICSVPHWLQDNAIPEGMTVESMGKLIQRISQRVYPVLPTAVGFCMLIPREVLDTVGLFDEETFGRGYGEENDWCMRAWYLGYQHYLDDATFIQHKGSMTFGDNPKKQALLTENLQKLAKKHPSYLPMVDRFIASDPLREIIDLIGLHLEFTNGKKNILEVLHADVRNQVGGTELHVRHLASHFSHEYNVFVLFPEPYHKRLTLVLYKNGSSTREFHFPVEQTTMTTLMYNTSVMKIMKQVLSEASIEFVHFHHLMHLPLTLPEVCTSAGVPYVCTVHDYFFYCQCPQLLDQGKVFCEFSKDKERCTSCIANNPHMQEKKGLTFSVLEQRRQVWKRILEGAHKVITPSDYVKGSLEKELNIPSEQIEVIPHGLDYVIMRPKGEQTRDKLRVTFLGAFTSIKGSKLFAELVLSTDHPHVEFYILGAIGDTETFQRIHKKVKYLGPFERTDVSSLLHRNEIDVVVLPSIWPETFAYTLSEAWGSGLKVITTSLGAQLDRLQSRKDAGWAFPITTWARETRSLLHELWDQKSGGVNLGYYGGVGNTVEVMLSGYGKLYANGVGISMPRVNNISTSFLFTSQIGHTSSKRGNKKTKLYWHNYIYLFLVKVRLISIVRPIYYRLKKSGK